jgi:hypothetical protein
VDPGRLDTRDTIMEAIGIEVTDLSEDRVVATMPVHGPTRQPFGVLQVSAQVHRSVGDELYPAYWRGLLFTEARGSRRVRGARSLVLERRCLHSGWLCSASSMTASSASKVSSLTVRRRPPNSTSAGWAGSVGSLTHACTGAGLVASDWLLTTTCGSKRAISCASSSGRVVATSMLGRSNAMPAAITSR